MWALNQPTGTLPESGKAARLVSAASTEDAGAHPRGGAAWSRSISRTATCCDQETLSGDFCLAGAEAFSAGIDSLLSPNGHEARQDHHRHAPGDGSRLEVPGGDSSDFGGLTLSVGGPGGAPAR